MAGAKERTMAKIKGRRYDEVIIDETKIREKLTEQMSDLFRSIPHRPYCDRQPPVEGNVPCSCDIGDRLLHVHEDLLGIIVEVTEE